MFPSVFLIGVSLAVVYLGPLVALLILDVSGIVRGAGVLGSDAAEGSSVSLGVSSGDSVLTKDSVRCIAWWSLSIARLGGRSLPLVCEAVLLRVLALCSICSTEVVLLRSRSWNEYRPVTFLLGQIGSAQSLQTVSWVLMY
jgi:hypothetical protein